MIHPTAVISPRAHLDPERVEVGPYCVIGEHVALGNGCRLHSHVVLDGPCEIGQDNEFFPFSSLGLKTQDLKYEGEPTFLVVGEGNTFREHVTVHRGTRSDLPTRIGDRNYFLAYAHIAHDCQVGHRCIFSNNGTLAGHVEVADHVIVSGLAAIHQFCRLGAHSIVGGCAKVVQDVPPYMIVDGNPAVVRGVNLVGLERHDFSAESVKALKLAYRKLFLKKDKNLGEAVMELRETQESQEECVAHLLNFIETSKRGLVR